MIEEFSHIILYHSPIDWSTFNVYALIVYVIYIKFIKMWVCSTTRSESWRVVSYNIQSVLKAEVLKPRNRFGALVLEKGKKVKNRLFLSYEKVNGLLRFFTIAGKPLFD